MNHQVGYMTLYITLSACISHSTVPFSTAHVCSSRHVLLLLLLLGLFQPDLILRYEYVGYLISSK